MIKFLKQFLRRDFPKFGALDLFKYIGPGLLVTVGFIDPGNWASNMAAGSMFGYRLLWIVTLSTVMLVLIQHNAAHLGIATGLCLSEAATLHFKPWVGRLYLSSAMAGSIATALAEILGAAIGINMIVGLPLPAGAAITAIVSLYLIMSNNYRRIEKYIIGFVSIIGLSFVFELTLVHVDWAGAAWGWTVPSFPPGSIPIMMSVLGAVVMPHNLYLHSEIIQSRQWNRESEGMIARQLRFEIADTIFAMCVGWAINSAMIIMAATVFFSGGVIVTNLSQANATLTPLLGSAASTIFAVALIFAGLASSITAGMAGGSIFAGFFGEPLDVTDRHSRAGILITILGGFAIALFLTNPFTGLIWSQIALSMQLPWAVAGLIILTTSKKVMGKYRNGPYARWIYIAITAFIAAMNLLLLLDMLNIYRI
jgi:manganese transport protein